MTKEQEDAYNILNVAALASWFTMPQLSFDSYVYGVDAYMWVRKDKNYLYFSIVNDPLAVIAGKTIAMDDDIDDLHTYTLSQQGKVYLKWLEREKEKEDIEVRKRKVELINAERIANTYGLTQTITWITFITVVILTALQIAEALRVWPYHK